MDTEAMNKADSAASLSAQQTALLDELTNRLVDVQSELGLKDLTIRDQEADRIVKNYVLAGSAMGLVPLPLFDLIALSGTQHHMLQQLCEHYGVDASHQRTRAVLIAVLSGSAPTLALISAGSAFKFFPGVGTLAGSAGLTVLGGAVTHALGQSFIRHFSQGGTLSDINTETVGTYFRRAFQQDKQSL